MTFLTPRQREILDYLQHYVDEHGYAPTQREICEHFGFSSFGTVQKHLTQLADKGLLQRSWNRRRGVELNVEDPPEGRQVPLLGTVVAGRPLEAFPDPEALPVPAWMVGQGAHFAVRVRGDSMDGEGIRDGDFVLVRTGVEARKGDLVVARIDEAETTLKRLERPAAGRVLLIAANPDYPAMEYEASRVAIQGVVTGLLRVISHR